RRAFRFRDLGPQVLKGLADPVGVAEIEYDAEEPTAFLTTTPFVGRDEEMARIAGRLHRAQASEGALVMVVGEPGIGKTRLAEGGEAARGGGGRGAGGAGGGARPGGPLLRGGVGAPVRAVRRGDRDVLPRRPLRGAAPRPRPGRPAARPPGAVAARAASRHSR